MIWYITIGFVFWNLVGAVTLEYILNATKITELFNPRYLYERYKVNYFGCAMLTLLTHILCPLGAFCYWFYVICTVGRK